ncbi:hypothetical protein U4T44_22530 [Klebsiella pneumoniae]|jgi:hypothetical protein|nr:MAG TPA: hypothetical protein [Caudoviricetes sp.]
MAIALKDKNLDASGFAAKYRAAVPDGLEYINVLDSAELAGRNLTGGAGKKVIGQPVFKGKSGGAVFRNSLDYIDEIIQQHDEFTLMAVMGAVSPSGPNYVISNSRSIATNVGFTLGANNTGVSLFYGYVNPTSNENSFKSVSIPSEDVAVAAARIKTKYVAGDTVAILQNLTKDARATITATAEMGTAAPKGGAFRVGSGYSATVQYPAEVFTVMAWSRFLTDDEIALQHIQLQEMYIALGVLTE